MENYLLKEKGDIEKIYLPGLWRLKDNFLPPHLPRTQSCLVNSLVFTCNKGAESSLEPVQISLFEYNPKNTSHKFRGFKREKFIQDVPLPDFIEDIKEVVRSKKEKFIQDLNEELEKRNETSVKLHLVETFEQIDETSEDLKKEIKSRDQIDAVVIEVLLDSYASTREYLKNRFDKIYPDLFTNKTRHDVTGSKINYKASNGLILASGTISPKKAKRLTKWLKEAGFISPETQYQTVQNIFVKEQTFEKITKVKWTGVNKDLKYFINGLQKRSLVSKSSLQTKWKDVASVFVNEDGQEFEHTQFSGNTGSPTEKKKQKLDAILRKFEAEIKESLTSPR